MAEWSMALRSGRSLLWRRGLESRFCQIIINRRNQIAVEILLIRNPTKRADTPHVSIHWLKLKRTLMLATMPFQKNSKPNLIQMKSNQPTQLATQRENLGSIRQDGRVVYGAAFRSQSPLEARVRIPLLSERKLREYQAGWPSGLWRCVQVAVSFGGAGSNPASVRYNFCSASILLLEVRFHSTLYLLGRRPASSVGRALDS
ncbi:unnamed protein product [Clavelina lepadiformis]|uniref:Uncharacterized protein n=1 Tax=Clavelina lepadiformis TaxID=159417 RepID=A0ABP0FYM4_CLALP